MLEGDEIIEPRGDRAQGEGRLGNWGCLVLVCPKCGWTKSDRLAQDGEPCSLCNTPMSSNLCGGLEADMGQKATAVRPSRVDDVMLTQEQFLRIVKVAVHCRKKDSDSQPFAIHLDQLFEDLYDEAVRVTQRQHGH